MFNLRKKKCFDYSHHYNKVSNKNINNLESFSFLLIFTKKPNDHVKIKR